MDLFEKKLLKLAASAFIAFLICYLGVIMNELLRGDRIDILHAGRVTAYFSMFFPYPFFNFPLPPLFYLLWGTIYICVFKNKFPIWLLLVSLTFLLEFNITQYMKAMQGQGVMVLKSKANGGGELTLSGVLSANLMHVGWFFLFAIGYLIYCYRAEIIKTLYRKKIKQDDI